MRNWCNRKKMDEKSAVDTERPITKQQQALER